MCWQVPREVALMAPFVKVRAWRERAASATAPHYDDATAFLRKVAKNMERAAAANSSKL